MKKQLFLLAALFTLGVSLNFIGCGSTPATAPTAPSGPVPLCASPSSQGLTAIGASTVSISPQNIETQAITLASAETATAISLYVDSGPVTGQARFAIYGDTGGTYPGNLIVETSGQNLVAASWNTISLPNIYLPAGVYWMAFNTSNGYPNRHNVVGGTNNYLSYGWSVFPDTFPAAVPSDAWFFSLYLTTCP